MKLTLLYEDILKNFKQPRIPVGDIFFHDNVHGDGIDWGLSKKLDVFKDDENFKENPIKRIPVDKLIPTQKFISADNLEKVKGTLKNENTNAYIVEYKGDYYIIDGHHRIAIRILRGDDTIVGYVHSIK